MRIHGTFQRRPAHETVVVVAAVVVAVALSVGIFARRATIGSERALIHELAALRNASALYCALNRSLAPDLGAVVAGSADGGEGTRLSSISERAFNSGERIVDPFGNPYLYDPATGWISSQTKGYELW